MISKFEISGRTYEGEAPEGKNYMVLFRLVCKIWVDLDLFKKSDKKEKTEIDKINETIELIHSVASHPKAEEAAKLTFIGWSLDGVEVTPKNWSELFEVKGRYHDVYAACIRVWMEAGFLAIGNT